LPADGADGDLARFRFNVLGPFEARYDRRQVDVTGVACTVLAVLTASPGHVLSVGRIVADLWDSQPPDGAERAVASYVSRLRRTLGAASGDVDATGGGHPSARVRAGRFVLERGRRGLRDKCQAGVEGRRGGPAGPGRRTLPAGAGAVAR
jgi:hypothetical protein